MTKSQGDGQVLGWAVLVWMVLMLVGFGIFAGVAYGAPQTAAAMEQAATAAKASGCSTTIAAHVYKPARLAVYSKCVTVTGTIVDATHGKRTDGVRKEADGDTHGWLKLDPPFVAMLNSGNKTHEGGNLVFEIVCYWKPTQPDAIASCPSAYHNAVQLLPVGSHVAITGAYVQDENHSHWMEIHAVTKIRAVEE